MKKLIKSKTFLAFLLLSLGSPSVFSLPLGSTSGSYTDLNSSVFNSTFMGKCFAAVDGESAIRDLLGNLVKFDCNNHSDTNKFCECVETISSKKSFPPEELMKLEKELKANILDELIKNKLELSRDRFNDLSDLNVTLGEDEICNFNPTDNLVTDKSLKEKISNAIIEKQQSVNKIRKDFNTAKNRSDSNLFNNVSKAVFQNIKGKASIKKFMKLVRDTKKFENVLSKIDLKIQTESRYFNPILKPFVTKEEYTSESNINIRSEFVKELQKVIASQQFDKTSGSIKMSNLSLYNLNGSEAKDSTLTSQAIETFQRKVRQVACDNLSDKLLKELSPKALESQVESTFAESYKKNGLGILKSYQSSFIEDDFEKSFSFDVLYCSKMKETESAVLKYGDLSASDRELVDKGIVKKDALSESKGKELANRLNLSFSLNKDNMELVNEQKYLEETNKLLSPYLKISEALSQYDIDEDGYYYISDTEADELLLSFNEEEKQMFEQFIIGEKTSKTKEEFLKEMKGIADHRKEKFKGSKKLIARIATLRTDIRQSDAKLLRIDQSIAIVDKGLDKILGKDMRGVVAAQSKYKNNALSVNLSGKFESGGYSGTSLAQKGRRFRDNLAGLSFGSSNVSSGTSVVSKGQEQGMNSVVGGFVDATADTMSYLKAPSSDENFDQMFPSATASATNFLVDSNMNMEAKKASSLKERDIEKEVLETQVKNNDERYNEMLETITRLEKEREEFKTNKEKEEMTAKIDLLAESQKKLEENNAQLKKKIAQSEAAKSIQTALAPIQRKEVKRVSTIKTPSRFIGSGSRQVDANIVGGAEVNSTGQTSGASSQQQQQQSRQPAATSVTRGDKGAVATNSSGSSTSATGKFELTSVAKEYDAGGDVEVVDVVLDFPNLSNIERETYIQDLFNKSGKDELVLVLPECTSDTDDSSLYCGGKIVVSSGEKKKVINETVVLPTTVPVVKRNPAHRVKILDESIDEGIKK